MKASDLPQHWENKKGGSREQRKHSHSLRLPLEDAARLAALEELYPDQDAQTILDDLAAAALDQVSEREEMKKALEETERKPDSS